MTAAEVAERIASECMGVTLKDGVVHPDLMTGAACQTPCLLPRYLLRTE